MTLRKAAVLLSIIFFYTATLAQTAPTKDYTVAVYYFPNYHIGDTRNEQEHGKGWSEWELLKVAKPRFKDQQQPKVPLWGYTNEADPKQMAQKIDAAASNGVDAFIFDWYYYNDGPFLEKGLDEGFLKAANNRKLKFALMWANHNWTDIHPLTSLKPKKILYPGAITPDTWDKMTDLIIRKYFKHPSYWLIDGAPYLSIYDLSKFLESFGSTAAARAALEAFRKKTIAAGFKDLNLNGVVWGQTILPGEKVIADPAAVVDTLGFNSVTSYVWIHHVGLNKFPYTEYDTVSRKYFDYAVASVKKFHVPYYPNIMMGWDSSPRTRADEPYRTDLGYPYMPIIINNTPAAFKQSLLQARNFLDEHPASGNILTINAWNEWTEGSYLEPDTVHKMGYLQAIKDVFGK